MAKKPTDEVQLKLRFDERLRRRIAKEAERNNRSMNAEIIHRLEESFRQEDTNELVSRAAREAVEYATSLADLHLPREEREARAKKRLAGIDPDAADEQEGGSK
jgi:hypothetical protein